MKPRTVIVTLEIETDAPLKVLSNRKNWAAPQGINWANGATCRIKQAVATVAQPPAPPSDLPPESC